MYANLLYCNLIQLNCGFSCSVATFTFVDICWWFLKGNKSSVHHFVFSPSNCCLSCTCARFHFLYMCFQEGCESCTVYAGMFWYCLSVYQCVCTHWRQHAKEHVQARCTLLCSGMTTSVLLLCNPHRGCKVFVFNDSCLPQHYLFNWA